MGASKDEARFPSLLSLHLWLVQTRVGWLVF